MPSPPNRYRRLIALGTLAGLAVAAFLAWQLFKKPSLGDELKAGEADYERGVKALEAKDGPRAVTAFDQALGKANEVLGNFDELQKSGKVKQDEAAKIEVPRGAAAWLKARALRDKAYAQAQAAGQPIPEPTDTSTRQSYRAFRDIPDAAAKKEAFAALDEAFTRLPTHPDIVREVLRLQLSVDPPRWATIAHLARATLESTPDDSRANYLMARIDFEQFDDKGQPAPPERRDPDRVLKAAKALAESKKGGNYPLWRTLDLDAQITRWLLAQPPEKRPGFDAAAEAARLRELLFDPKTGALARAAAGEAFDGMSRFDVTGIMDLHRAAVEVAAADKDAPRVAAALKGTLAVARVLSDHPVGQLQAEEVTEILTDAAARGRPAAAPADWATFQTDLEAFGKAAAAQKKWYAGASVRLAEFRTAAGDDTAAEAWYAEAAVRPRMPLDLKAEIHTRLIDLRAARGAPAAEAADSLKTLAELTDPKAVAAREFFAGLFAERAGRLGEAYAKFSAAANADPGGEYGLRAFAALPGTALALGKYTEAATVAKEVDRGWAALAKLDRFGQAWVKDHLAGQDEAVALIVVAQARERRQRLEKKDKGKPADLTRWAETANTLVKRLDPKGNPGVAARLARLEVLALAGLTGEAKAAADDVRATAPAGALLRAELPAADVAARTAADARAKAVGGLFWAEWLASTDRVAAAAGELETANAKPLAGLVKGMDRAAAAALIRAVAMADDATALTAERAAGRRAKAAVTLYGEGKGTEAAATFDALAEVTDLKEAAAAGKRVAETKKG